MEEIVSARDRTALFRQGITIVEAGRSDGRLIFEATGGDDDRVRDVIRARFGADAEVWVVDGYPRYLQVFPCAGHMEREEGRLQLRWVLWPGETIADIVVVEDDECVVVLGLKSVPYRLEEGEPCEVPTHVYLDSPLAGRTVYDGCGGREVAFKNVYDGIEARVAARVAAEGRTAAGG